MADHSHMDHGHMDHGHMGHDMPGMAPMKCNMNMLFTWDTTNLCIVFEGWRITSTGSLIASLIAIVLLTAGYEAVREASRRYEAHAAKLGERRGADDPDESSSLLSPGRNGGKNAEQQVKIVKGILYAVQVFYSFFIMLLFMTYNGWIMLAVSVGAFVGYMMFSQSSSTKSVACH